MIRIAICDDEKNIRAYLCTLVRKQDSENEITEYASADEYLSGGMEHDLLLLDIEMKGSASGMNFFYPFMAEKKERRKSILKKVLIVFLSYVMMYLIGEMVPIYDWLCMVIVIALLVAVSRFLSMERNDTFLLGTLFFSIKEMSRLITESLHYVFSKKIVQGLIDKNLIYRNAAIGYSITMLLRYILLFVMLFAVMYRLQKKQLKLCIKELCYLCLIPIASILFGNIIFRLYFTVKGTVFFSLYEQYPAFIGLVPLITSLFYAGIVITVMSYQEI